MSRPTQYDEKYKQLQAKYVEALPDRIASIQETWKKLCTIGWDNKSFERLNVIVHKLAGTGRNYGFEEMGKHAQLLDLLLIKIHEAGCMPTAEEKTHITTKLEQMIGASKSASVITEEVLPVPENAEESSDIIFIVDDDEDNLEFISLLVNASGYKTRTFISLKEFHEALETTVPDIIIMDIIFPEGHLAGIEAINQVKSSLGKNTPVIFISARTDVIARIRALRAGGCAYITKPVDATVLLSTIDKNTVVHQRPRRALMIDDDEWMIEFCQVILEENNVVMESTTDPLEMLYKIEEFDPDVLLIDFNMPRCNGEELVQLLRQDHRYINLPVIMISGEHDAALRERLLALGSARFLNKPLAKEEFIKTLNESLVSSYKSRKRMLDLLKYSPQGLINTRYFYTELESVIASARDDETPYTLLYFAIDEPDYIRDKVGVSELEKFHDKVTAFIKTLASDNDHVAQLTDYVFLFLIRAHKDELDGVVRSLNQQLSEHVFAMEEGDVTGVTASIGVLSIQPGLGNADEVIDAAEEASLVASKKGGNQFYSAVRVTSSSDVSGAYDSTELLKIFNEDSLRLQYQPIVNIEKAESVYEAYARLVKNDQVIAPGEFMPFIRNNKFEYEFNKKVVAAAIADLSSTKGSISSKAHILVKLEPAEDLVSKFLPWFSNLIGSSRIRGSNRIIFCFREDGIYKQQATIKQFVKSTRLLKCDVAIEHLSISNHAARLVSELNPVYSKLSREFVADLLYGDANAIKILKDILATKTKVVASSMEDAATFTKLWDLGVRHYQGYFVQKPQSGFTYDFSHRVM